MLEQDEYIEQAFFFKSFLERLLDGYSSQEILKEMKYELLSTVKLPMAVDILLTEVKLTGVMNTAMKRLNHYFTSFQTFVVQEAEQEEGRFDFKTALQILEREAQYRSESGNVQGLFFYQLETICRNRLGYDRGLEAMANDPTFNAPWRQWIRDVLRNQIGIIDLADLIYVRSGFYERKPSDDPNATILFGQKEGRIAHACRKRDPSFLFSAISRHLGYPSVPRPPKLNDQENLIPILKHRIDLLELKVQLLEEELRGGINLERFYKKED